MRKLITILLLGTLSLSAMSWLQTLGRAPLAIGSSFFGSDLQFSILGSQDVSPTLQQRVNRLASAVGIKNHVSVKQMNEFALDIFGHQNLFATHTAVFVNEAWFNTLEHDLQEFILAHELAHILHKDVARILLFTNLCIVASVAGLFYPSYHVKLASLVGLICAPLLKAYAERYVEFQADRIAAKHVNPQAAITYFGSHGHAESKGIMGFVDSLYDDHPSHSERAENLTA